jgi:hypothetical protein
MAAATRRSEVKPAQVGEGDRLVRAARGYVSVVEPGVDVREAKGGRAETLEDVPVPGSTGGTRR